MTRNELLEYGEYKYYYDQSYFHLWAIAEHDNKNFNGAVHVHTKEEAQDICRSFNALKLIYEIAIDCDGYRDVNSLTQLVGELKEIAGDGLPK